MGRQRCATAELLCATLYPLLLPIDLFSSPFPFLLPLLSPSPPLSIGFTIPLRDIHQTPLDLNSPLPCWTRAAFWRRRRFWKSWHQSGRISYRSSPRELKPWNTPAHRHHYATSVPLHPPQSRNPSSFPRPKSFCESTSHLPRYGLGTLVSGDNLAELETGRRRIPSRNVAGPGCGERTDSSLYLQAIGYGRLHLSRGSF